MGTQLTQHRLKTNWRLYERAAERKDMIEALPRSGAIHGHRSFPVTATCEKASTIQSPSPSRSCESPQVIQASDSVIA